MTLYVERVGQGPDLVMLHGWGLNGAVWGPLREALLPHARLHIVDLPGHGLSHATPLPSTLAETVELVARDVPSRAAWLGWSLGGLIALAAAIAKPDQVRKLALIATTPRFVATNDWPHGVSVSVLQQFADSLRSDFPATLQQFLALQALGMPQARSLTRELTVQMLTRPTPNAATLEAGLALLRDSALEARVAQLQQSLLVVHGAQDRLVPVSAGEFMASKAPRAQLLRFERAGHVPFLSHTREVADRIAEFLHVA